MQQNDYSLLEHFSSHLTSLNRSSGTVRNYNYNIRRFLRWLHNSNTESCLEVTWQDIEQYQLWLMKQPHYCVASVETYLRAVRAFFKHLRKHNIIASDPSSLVQLPKHHRNLPRNVLTRAEICRLLNAPDTNTDAGVLYRTILEVFYGTALRLSELCNLSLSDVNVNRQELRVRGKGSKDRIQPLSETVCDWLKIYIETVRTPILSDQEETVLFLGCSGGRPLNTQVVEAVVRRYSQQARINKKVTPHTLRATTATHMLKKGASLPVVQSFLGHSLISTTERYTRVAQGDLIRAIRKHHPREKVLQDEL